MSTPQQTEAFDRRFLAAFAVLLIVLVMAYLFAVTFAPMASNGGKYADIAVPLLLGTVIGGLVGYFFGASKNAQAPKNEPPPTVLVDGNVTGGAPLGDSVSGPVDLNETGRTNTP